MTSESRTEQSLLSCRISGPAELLQAVPYLLGFHPTDSLVLVGLHGGRLVVTARMDLVDAHIPEIVAQTLDAMIRGGSSSVLAAIYDDSAAGELSLRMTLHAVSDAADAAGCDLLEVLVVAGGRWWSLLCIEPSCCPPEGNELLAEPSAFAAAATFEGVVALPDRATLAAVLDPLPADQRGALLPLVQTAQSDALAAAAGGSADRFERSVKRSLFAAARESAAIGWVVPGAAACARFGAALADDRLRDPVWMAVDDGRLDGRPLWRELGRRLPSPYDAAPLLLFGWASWRAGDGTLAGIAAERAVASNPDCTAADLLLAALSHGIDPRRAPRLRLRRPA